MLRTTLFFSLAAILLTATGCPPPAQTKRPPRPQPRPQPRPKTRPVSQPQPRPQPYYQPIPRTMTPSPAPTRTAMRSEVIGRSVQGRPIYMHVFGNGANPALVFGGIHGNERNSSEMADLLITHLQNNPQLTRNRSVAVIPHANPDGLVANTRSNVRKVDLNRNFPAKNWKREGSKNGTQPLSEPEAVALHNVVQRLRPRLAISLHSISGPRQCNNYDGPAAHVAKAMAQYNRYPVKGSIGYPTPGSFGSWCGKDLNVPTITLEIPKTMAGKTGWEQNRAALLAALGM